MLCSRNWSGCGWALMSVKCFMIGNVVFTHFKVIFFLHIRRQYILEHHYMHQCCNSFTIDGIHSISMLTIIKSQNIYVIHLRSRRIIDLFMGRKCMSWANKVHPIRLCSMRKFFLYVNQFIDRYNLITRKLWCDQN